MIMENKVIAIKPGKKLIYTHNESVDNVELRMGYILLDNQVKVPVLIDSVLARGYWEMCDDYNV